MSKIEDPIARGETLEVEFKIDANDTELVEAVVCLANGGGGTLLVGVDDDGTVAGARPRHGTTTDRRRVEALQQEQMVLQYARQHGQITRREAAELCRINENQAAFVLKKLKDSNRLRLIGKGRTAYYVGF